MKRVFQSAFIIVIALLLVNTSHAQDRTRARIHGTVIDSRTNETLIGVNVVIAGTTLGTATNLNGEYTISQLAAGTYTVSFRYIGYKTVVIPDIELSPGEVLELNVELEVEAITAEEVVISVQATGQRAAINQQLASSAITHIVSSERIRDVPDLNAAESIGRLPGVSLIRQGGEGNKVVIRGLSPQFAIIEMDGVRMPGASGDRSVGLNTVSSEMLDGIELTKSLTPDKDADAIAGVVNLRTRVAREGLQFNVYGTGIYNNINNSYNNFGLTGSVGNRFFDNRFGVLVSAGRERVDRSAEQFSGGYGKIITADEDQIQTNSANITQTERIRERTNASLVLDYRTSFMHLKLNNIYSGRTDNVLSRQFNYGFGGNNYVHNIFDDVPSENLQLHSLSGDFSIGSSELYVDYSYIRTRADSDRDLYRFEDRESLSKNPIQPTRRIFAQPENLIRDYYIGAAIPEMSVVRWNETQKVDREDVTQTINARWKVPYRVGDISGYLQTGFKYQKKDRYNDVTTKYTYFHGGIGSGRQSVFYNSVYPNFIRPRDVGSSNSWGLSGVNFVDPNHTFGDFMQGRFDFPWTADLNYLKEVFGNLYSFVENHPDMSMTNFHQVRGVPTYNSDYETVEELMAGYMMTEIKIGNLMLLPGVRMERIQTEYTSNFVQEDQFDNFGLAAGFPIPVTAYRENLHWFPSVNMKYDVAHYMDIRAAYYRSAARPDFNLLSPSLVRDDDFTSISSYNPYLKPALANNYDLGVSFYTNRLGLLTLNGFYKDISDLVYRIPEYKPAYLEQLRVTGAPQRLIESLEAPEALYDTPIYTVNTSNNNKPINNPNNTTYYGFEVSLQTNFWYLPKMLQGVVLDLNYSMTWSHTKLPFIDFEPVLDTTGFFPITRYFAAYQTRESRMLDQPAHLFNARIGYDIGGLSSRLSFRYQASTITRIDPIHYLLDEYNLAMFRIDLNIKQKITPRLSVSLDIANLNNYIDERVIDALGRTFPRNIEYYGSNVILGVRYDF